MLTAALVIFILTAILGIIIVIPAWKEQVPPAPAVYGHGILALIGVILLIIYTTSATGEAPLASLIFFLIAVGGGSFLFYLGIAKQMSPKFLLVLHPTIGAIGLILLIVFMFGG